EAEGGNLLVQEMKVKRIRLGGQEEEERGAGGRGEGGQEEEERGGRRKRRGGQEEEERGSRRKRRGGQEEEERGGRRKRRGGAGGRGEGGQEEEDERLSILAVWLQRRSVNREAACSEQEALKSTLSLVQAL
ncbi:hypothetical protein KUCAC02_031637, partial [Chaenocephalus aceratus]